MSAAPDDRADLDIPDSGVKAVQVTGELDCATVVNALEMAKDEDGIETDREAFVEVCATYAGWRAEREEG